MSIQYSLLAARSQPGIYALPFQTWTLGDGTMWTEFYRKGNDYLLRFPGVADFEISADTTEVRCHPAVDADPDTVEHRYLHQVHPLVLSQRGRLIFHASAVEIDGRAVAFAAPSGRGKSTLAAAFATRGCPFLTDDGLMLERTDGGVRVLPSHPFLRLWDDSRASVLGAARGTTGEPDGCKTRIPADRRVAFCDTPRPLRRVYFLDQDSASAVTCRRLGPSEALVAWVEHSYLLDPEEPALVASHFENVAMLASMPLAYLLTYPRRFDALPQLQQTIIEHLREEDVDA